MYGVRKTTKGCPSHALTLGIEPRPGADPGGGGPGGPFWGTLKLQKEGKALRECTRMQRVLVLNISPDPAFQNPVFAPARPDGQKFHRHSTGDPQQYIIHNDSTLLNIGQQDRIDCTQ